MAELNVSRKNIEGLLSLNDPTTKGKIFVIPDYQRPYRWETNTCDVLWNDLRNFYEEHKNDNREYFLGSIVTCTDEDNPDYINIIDGQQRITSFLLLLRAFYYKLEKQNEESPDDEVSGLMSSIEPCIWKINPMTKKVSDKKETHIKTLVATDDDKGVFDLILETGEFGNKSNSYYARNYSYFLEQCDEYAKAHMSGWKGFCLFILSRCIVLPIECVDLDSALTIFGTLNNRGLPLADSDIFKAELYKIQSETSKRDFANNWKELEENVKRAGFSLDDLFRFYMHIDRAKHNVNTDEISLRNYYSGKGNKYEIFKEKDFFENLMRLGEFWVSIYSYEEKYCNEEGLKYIQCLFAYPNDYWKHPVSVFFFKNNDLGEEEFKEKLAAYLKKLLSFMFVRFIETPTVNNVKRYIFNFCIDTYKGEEINCSSYKMPEDIAIRINTYLTPKMTKALLLLNTYLFDTGQKLIGVKLDIEHIFPQKWQNTNYNGWNQEDAMEHLNMLGNKIVFEKPLNIQAGNGYFEKKKEKYRESTIKEVQYLARMSQTDWLKEDIEKRNGEIIERLCRFFKENIPQPIVNEKEILSFELKLGSEFYRLYKIVDGDSNVLRYKLESHICDRDNSNFLHRKYIDKTASYENIQSALSGIDKEMFVRGEAELKDDTIRDEISEYFEILNQS